MNIQVPEASTKTATNVSRSWIGLLKNFLGENRTFLVIPSTKNVSGELLPVK